MITTTLFILSFVFLLGMMVFVFAVRMAPAGFEDREGFHSGEPVPGFDASGRQIPFLVGA